MNTKNLMGMMMLAGSLTLAAGCAGPGVKAPEPVAADWTSERLQWSSDAWGWEGSDDELLGLVDLSAELMRKAPRNCPAARESLRNDVCVLAQSSGYSLISAKCLKDLPKLKGALDTACAQTGLIDLFDRSSADRAAVEELAERTRAVASCARAQGRQDEWLSLAPPGLRGAAVAAMGYSEGRNTQLTPVSTVREQLEECEKKTAKSNKASNRGK